VAACSHRHPLGLRQLGPWPVKTVMLAGRVGPGSCSCS